MSKPLRIAIIAGSILCIGGGIWGWYHVSTRLAPSSPTISAEVALAVPENVPGKTMNILDAPGPKGENIASLTPIQREERYTILSKKAEYLTNMKEYQEVYRTYESMYELKPSDKLKRDLAHVAYQAKAFQRSSDLYKIFLSSLTEPEKIEILHALRYTFDDAFSGYLANMPLDEATREAFRISWTCEYEYISCEQAIREASYTSAYVTDLRNALATYERLGNSDGSYKGALLAGAMYKNEDYTTAMRIGQYLLKSRPDYRPVLKIVGFSAFMIGDYERALGILNRYKQYEPQDSDVDFIMGILYFEKGDYETSNIYLNKAVLSGYKPKIQVERKLAYNYYVMERMKNMFQVLGYLMLEPDMTELDAINSIYLALREDEIHQASIWLEEAMKKYPSSDTLLGLKAWHERRIGNIDTARAILTQLLEKSPNNPLALTQMGILQFETQDVDAAKITLEKAASLNAGGVWGEMIEEYLKQLRIKEK